VPKFRVTRLTLAAVGGLLLSLPLTGTHLVRDDLTGAPGADAADLRLVSHRCSGFRPKDVLRGRASRQGPTCRPIGINGEVVRAPIAKAKKRDRHNYMRKAHGKRRHKGTDFRARCGTAVRAAHTGKAIVIKKRGRKSVGISTGPRRLTTWYGPLRKITVRNGRVVQGGQRVGTVGRAKRKSRCHLHFAVHLRGGASDPARVNPSRWLRRYQGHHVSGMAPGQRSKGTFVVATLNVLGHSHTARGGKKRRQFAGSGRRMEHAVGLLHSNHVALVGLQELQPVQRRLFLKKTRGWRMHSPRDPQDSIAWRTSRFRLVRATTFKIPYFRKERPMPVVTLRDRATGRKLSVISVHNPADRRGKKRMHKRRAQAVSRELRMVKKLRRSTGAPVILMGDFNDKTRKFYCRVTKHGLKASSRGVRGKGCRPSVVAGIDWIFGTRGVRFVAHQRVHGGLVQWTTDHPFVLARVRR
jgi:hypothetical protein